MEMNFAAVLGGDPIGCSFSFAILFLGSCEMNAPESFERDVNVLEGSLSSRLNTMMSSVHKIRVGCCTVLCSSFEPQSHQSAFLSEVSNQLERSDHPLPLVTHVHP